MGVPAIQNLLWRFARMMNTYAIQPWRCLERRLHSDKRSGVALNAQFQKFFSKNQNPTPKIVSIPNSIFRVCPDFSHTSLEHPPLRFVRYDLFPLAGTHILVGVYVEAIGGKRLI